MLLLMSRSPCGLSSIFFFVAFVFLLVLVFILLKWVLFYFGEMRRYLSYWFCVIYRMTYFQIDGILKLHSTHRMASNLVESSLNGVANEYLRCYCATVMLYVTIFDLYSKLIL